MTDVPQGLVLIAAIAGVIRIPRHPGRKETTIYGLGWLLALVALTEGQQQPEWLVMLELSLSATLLATALVVNEVARRRERRLGDGM